MITPITDNKITTKDPPTMPKYIEAQTKAGNIKNIDSINCLFKLGTNFIIISSATTNKTSQPNNWYSWRLLIWSDLRWILSTNGSANNTPTVSPTHHKNQTLLIWSFVTSWFKYKVNVPPVADASIPMAAAPISKAISRCLIKAWLNWNFCSK